MLRPPIFPSPWTMRPPPSFTHSSTAADSDHETTGPGIPVIAIGLLLKRRTAHIHKAASNVHTTSGGVLRARQIAIWNTPQGSTHSKVKRHNKQRSIAACAKMFLAATTSLLIHSESVTRAASRLAAVPDLPAAILTRSRKPTRANWRWAW
jgi:hypothetical protein